VDERGERGPFFLRAARGGKEKKGRGGISGRWGLRTPEKEEQDDWAIQKVQYHPKRKFPIGKGEREKEEKREKSRLGTKRKKRGAGAKRFFLSAVKNGGGKKKKKKDKKRRGPKKSTPALVKKQRKKKKRKKGGGGDDFSNMPKDMWEKRGEKERRGQLAPPWAGKGKGRFLGHGISPIQGRGGGGLKNFNKKKTGQKRGEKNQANCKRIEMGISFEG